MKLSHARMSRLLSPLASLAALGLFSLGCSSFSLKAKSGSFLPRMKSQVGATSNTRYYSHAQIRNFEAGQLVREKQEIVDFNVVNTTTALHPAEEAHTMKVKTVRKDGTAPLHELAFPELNEEIEMKVNSRAKILKAGDFAPDSLFFIPVLPLPEKPVEVGDTWTLTHYWVTESSGIPLVLDLIGILKEARPCLKGDTCLDIEINGKVLVASESRRSDSFFDGTVWGRMIFAMNRGDVVWSETRGAEDIRIGSDRMVVASCLISQIQNEKTVIRKNDGFSCKPSREPVTETPAL